MNLKEIRFPIGIKSVNHARSYILQKAYTNDLDSVKIIFELLDCTTADLTGATASILLYMRDGSFFQDTATITDNTVTYILTESQGNHAGVAQAQVIVKKTGTEWASSKEKFEIVAGLETAVATETEVMIKDWTMLTAEARAFIDDAEAAESARAQTFSENEATREQTFSENEATRAQTFSANEATRETNETTRKAAEQDRVSAEQDRVTAETGRANAESARVTAEQGRAAALAEFEQHKLDYIEDKKEIKKDISTLKQIAHYDEVLEEYIGLDQFWNSLRNGKIYTTEFYQFDVSPSPNGVKKDDNEGLVCEPSTNTERGRNDYEKIGLFMSIDVNAYVDENDDYHVTAIKGDGRFKSDGTKGDVYVMSMPGYIKRYKDEEVWSISYSDAMHPGFEVIDEAVKPDGTIRPYLLHAKYIAGRNPYENNNLASISGVPAEHVGMSHNGQIAEFKEKGIQYSGKTSHDDFYVQLMFCIKYATTHSQSVMYGAASGYSLQYSNLVSEVGVKRVIVTNSQANNLLIGSTVSIGDYGDGEISASRGSAQNSNLADRVNIINITDLGDGNSAIYVETETEFDTSLTTTITTYPWNSGSCDNVLGQDGSLYDNLSGKEPFIINGIEMMVGGYEVLQNLIIHNNSDDDRTDVYVNYDCHTYSTSPTADYDLAGQLVSTDNAWRYGSKLSIPDSHPSVMLITEAEASSTTGFADGIYTNPPSTGGHRAWRSLGSLGTGTHAGLRDLNASGSLADSGWHLLGRLSATGRSRRRAGVN